VPEISDEAEEFWTTFAAGNPKLIRYRRVFRWLPSDPRCKMCSAPFKGFGRVLRFKGLGPSRMNPSFCNSCDNAPYGGAEMDIGVLFADVRGYTSMVESLPPDQAASLLNTFYQAGTRSLLRHDALINKFVGDEVMALFLPALVSGNVFEAMVSGASDFLDAIAVSEAEQRLKVGIGLAYGMSFVGMVGSGDVKEFTALGDVVNTASRLQGQASGGQIVMSEEVYGPIATRFPKARSVELELKGKMAPFIAYVVDTN
jgi:adenylate cyclase